MSPHFKWRKLLIPSANHDYTLQVCLKELAGRWKIIISQAHCQSQNSNFIGNK